MPRTGGDFTRHSGCLRPQKRWRILLIGEKLWCIRAISVAWPGRCCSALTVFAFSGGALAQWAWKDDNGRVVYSDRPPPAGVKSENIVRQPSNAQTGAAAAASRQRCRQPTTRHREPPGSGFECAENGGRAGNGIPQTPDRARRSRKEGPGRAVAQCDQGSRMRARQGLSKGGRRRTAHRPHGCRRQSRVPRR